MFGFGKREQPAARVSIETLYEAAVEVFNKSIAREDVTGRLNFEIGARTVSIEKKGGNRYLAIYRCDDVKAIVLAQLPPAMAMANRFDHFKVAREQLNFVAEQLAREEPPGPDPVKFLATLFVIAATVLTFGFATRS